MGRTKGTPKTGGRQAGTPNKVSGTLKEFLASAIDENREQVREDLKRLEPKDRLMIIERFMQYVTPKKRDEDVQPPMGATMFKIEYVGRQGDEKLFPNSEDEIDLERDKRWYKDVE